MTDDGGMAGKISRIGRYHRVRPYAPAARYVRMSVTPGVSAGLELILWLLPPMWLANGLWERTEGLGKFGLNRTSLAAIPVSGLSLFCTMFIANRLFNVDGPAQSDNLVAIFGGLLVYISMLPLMGAIALSLVSILFVGLAEKVIALCGAIVTLVAIAALLRVFF